MTTQSSTSRYLIVDDDALAVGDTLGVGDCWNPAVTDPERIRLMDYAEDLGLAGDGDDDRLLNLITNTLHDRTIRVAEVMPNGDVGPDHVHHAWCSHGWTIKHFLPYTRMFGPDGPRIVETVEQARTVCTGHELFGDHPYVDAVATHKAWDWRWSAGRAASDALATAHIDSWFWHEIGLHRAGIPALVLRARPYRGATPDWTDSTYNRLAKIYSEAFGEPLHTDDVLAA